ncbi:flavodoxin family protein [Yinghuangia seranimata]|uniref:flavodoxin family protein n=1 Tax=Yinghuangia seranimata TaxID=408067 RepID=UPI00248C2C44|nr:NAD(P)H-dependent oxidoreductase [Yinghuangia seranimata]MDI2129175.1 flavodoxin family protein [Yinghuangia seranimata]
MAVLLVVHHTPSPNLAELLDAALTGARDPDITGVDVQVRPALLCSPVEALQADAYLLGTPANIGYMSGALKHWFDQLLYLDTGALHHKPYGLYVHGGNDTAGAVKSVENAAQAMGLRRVRPPVECIGTVTKQHREACTDLAALVAAELMDA